MEPQNINKQAQLSSLHLATSASYGI